MAPDTGPLSWRDVYELVNDSSKTIMDRMETGFSEVRQVTSSHESRIASIEAANLVNHAAVEARRVLQEAQGRRNDRWLSGGRGIVVLLLAVGGFVLQIASRLNIF